MSRVSTLQLDYTTDEILMGHAVEDPLVVRGVVCHGGFVDGAYVSPRTRFRREAITAWQDHHRETTGTDVLAAPLETWPGHWPSLEQSRFLLREGVREPIIGLLTRIGTVEGYGGAIRDVTPQGDIQRHFVEDVRGTATAHLAKGLLEAHARDESGWAEQAGHNKMWYAVRDIAFEDPLTPDTEHELLVRMGLAAAPGAAPSKPATPPARLLPEIDPGIEALLGFMCRVLFIEIKAFHAFAWAEALLCDPDLVAGEGEAARIVSYIRADETPHVEYLRTALSEMRARTFVSESGRQIAGTEVIDRVWQAALADSLGPNEQRGRTAVTRVLEHALEQRADGPELLEQFHRLGEQAAPVG